MILRETLLTNYAKKSFARLNGAVELSVVPRDVHEKLVQIIGERDPEKIKHYFPQGLIPPQASKDRMIASICPSIAAEQTEDMGDDEAVNWLAYWITRMFIRLSKQATLADVTGDLPDERLLEEMVEDQIRAEAQDLESSE